MGAVGNTSVGSQLYQFRCIWAP